MSSFRRVFSKVPFWVLAFLSTMLGLIMLTLIFVVYKAETLHRAVLSDNGELVNRVLDKNPGMIESRNRLGRTPLQTAADYGHCQALNTLIKRGADVNSWWDCAKSPDESYNPLHITAINGQVEAARLLIAAGTDINARSLQGQTPLDVAVMNGHRELAQLFRDNGGRAGAVKLLTGKPN